MFYSELNKVIKNIETKLVSGEYLYPSISNSGYHNNDITIFDVSWAIFYNTTIICKRELVDFKNSYQIQNIHIIDLDGTAYNYNSIESLLDGLRTMKKIIPESVKIILK